jgi:dTMP kinase
MNKKIICITGIDGAGKTTLTEKIAENFSSVHVSNIWDLLDNPAQSIPFKSKKEIDDFLCELTPDSRLLFMSHALKYSIDKALSSDKEYILANGYYYKYFATELVLGANIELIKSLEKFFPKPDIVIDLVIDAENALLRKKYLSRYECGLSHNPNMNEFINFQNNVIEKWKNFNIENRYIINTTLSKDEVFAETNKLLKLYIF